MDHCFPIQKAQYKILQVALVDAGYSADYFDGLKPSCDQSRPELEERKAEWVELYVNALGAGVDLSTFPNVNECELVSADDAEAVWANRAKASLSTTLTGNNNDLVFTAKSYGSIGNILQVQYVDPSANSQALAVSLVGPLIKVSLATGSGGAITSTAALIKTAIEANASVNSLVSVANKTGNNGTGVVTAMAATNLSGGLD